MTCRSAINRVFSILRRPDRPPGECCRLCGAYNFGLCWKGAPVVLTEEATRTGAGTVPRAPDDWCPRFHKRPILAALDAAGRSPVNT